MKISACLVVYNEEKFIARALASLAGAVDEIILVHDGECLDRTITIAEKFGVKIFIRPHAGFMEAHLPFCFSQAAGEWIFRIDADEYLSDELRNNLKKICGQSDADAYEFLWPYFDGQKYITRSWPYKLCLFRRDKLSFLGIIHYLPANPGIVVRSNFKLRHEPDYNNFTWSCFIGKWASWARKQADNYFQDFAKVAKFNYDGSDWPSSIKIRKKHPILLIPFEFILTLAKEYRSGGYREMFIGCKSALMHACYRLLVNYSTYAL